MPKKTLQEMKKEAPSKIPSEWKNIQVDTAGSEIAESSQEILRKMRSEDKEE